MMFQFLFRWLGIGSILCLSNRNILCFSHSGIAMDCAACAHAAHELEGPTWAELIYTLNGRTVSKVVTDKPKLKVTMQMVSDDDVQKRFLENLRFHLAA